MRRIRHGNRRIYGALSRHMGGTPVHVSGRHPDRSRFIYPLVLRHVGAAGSVTAEALIMRLVRAYESALNPIWMTFPIPDVYPAFRKVTELWPTSPLAILTNGPAAHQKQRIAARGIDNFTPHWVNSKAIGLANPNPKFFRTALCLVAPSQRNDSPTHPSRTLLAHSPPPRRLFLVSRPIDIQPDFFIPIGRHRHVAFRARDSGRLAGT